MTIRASRLGRSSRISQSGKLEAIFLIAIKGAVILIAATDRQSRKLKSYPSAAAHSGLSQKCLNVSIIDLSVHSEVVVLHPTGAAAVAGIYPIRRQWRIATSAPDIGRIARWRGVGRIRSVLHTRRLLRMCGSLCRESAYLHW